MRAATQPAQINYHRDQQPQQINSRRRHAAVQFPCVYDRGERQENEAEYRQHQTTVECALQVGRSINSTLSALFVWLNAIEKIHINTSATRGNSRRMSRRKQGIVTPQWLSWRWMTALTWNVLSIRATWPPMAT